MLGFCRNVQIVSDLRVKRSENLRLVYLGVDMRVVALGVVEHGNDMLFKITPVPVTTSVNGLRDHSQTDRLLDEGEVPVP